ncbi:MAG: putative porin [Candidatus Sulfobium sp.]|jgi:hypothetical protein
MEKGISFSRMGVIVLIVLMQLVFAGIFAASARASDVDVLIDKLVEKGVLTRSDAEAILKETKEAERKEQPKAEQMAKAEKAAAPSWTDNIKFFGDFRLRNQWEHREGKDARDRGRFRWRFGAEAKVVDNLQVGFRLASGGDDPRSTNQTFEDIFSSKSMRIDRAYARYEPVGWLTLTGGKFANPIWTTADLLWDDDINPEGLAAHVYMKGEPVDVFFNTGLFVMNQFKNSSEPLMFPLQLGVNWKVAENTDLKLAGSYYYFSGLQGETLDFSAKTNTLVPGDGLKYKYNAFTAETELGLRDVIFPYVGLFGTYVYNPDPSDNNQGFLAGVKFGDKKVSKGGDWQVKYMYRYLETDAWPDVFPDSDFFGGATNVKGHEAVASYGLMKHVTLGLDYYHSSQIHGTTDEDLFQTDLVFKF